MHKVERNSPPESLVELNKKYLENFDEDTVNTTREWKKINSNQKKDILNSLNEIFNGFCGYCEGTVGTTSYPNIDHFKPKSIFPKLMFEYNNMIFSCQMCNTLKKEKWDELFFNPTEEDPELHIKFEKEIAIPLDEKGNKMIDVLKLNRESVLKFRKNIYDIVEKMVITAKEKIDTLELNDKEKVRNCIERFDDAIYGYTIFSSYQMPYSTMTKQNFSKIIRELKEKREELMSSI